MSTIAQIERLVCLLAGEVKPLESGMYTFSMAVFLDVDEDGFAVIVPGPANLRRVDVKDEN